jgi:hypothetical protein
MEQEQFRNLDPSIFTSAQECILFVCRLQKNRRLFRQRQIDHCTIDADSWH